MAFKLHQKYIKHLNDTALTLQCWVRISTAVIRVSAKRARLAADKAREVQIQEQTERLEAADLEQQRERERLEEQRRQLEKEAQWQLQQTERELQFIARETVRKRAQFLENQARAGQPAHLSALNEVVHCLRRFPGDVALQVDGFRAITECASKSPVCCHVLLDEGVATILAESLDANPDDDALKTAAATLSKLLCVADDLKRAMPDAFEADVKRMKSGEQTPGLPEREFWEKQMQRLNLPPDQPLPPATPPAPLIPKNEWVISNMKFDSYTMSPENSLYMKSVFEEDSVPTFDLSCNIKAPPVVPPVLDLDAVRQQHDAVGENAPLDLLNNSSIEKDEPLQQASGSFVHTPYAIPLRRPKKNRKSRDSRDINGYQPPLNQHSSILTDSMLTDVDAQPSQLSLGQMVSPENSGVRPHTSTGTLRNSRMSVSAAPESQDDQMLFLEGDNQMLVLDEDLTLQPHTSTGALRNSRMSVSAASESLDDQMMFFDGDNQMLVLDNAPAPAPAPTLDERSRNDVSGWADDQSRGGRLSPAFESFEDLPRKPLPAPIVASSPATTPRSGKKKKRRAKTPTAEDAAEGSAPPAQFTPNPRMEGEVFFNKRLQELRTLHFSPKHNKSLTPVHYNGPTPEKLVKHKTVQKIFENAAPPKVVEKQRNARNPADVNIGASGQLGRRHSVRDMVQIFQILDEADTGCIPAPKFANALMAMSGLHVKKDEVQGLMKDFEVKMEEDHIDYEEFCSTGNILRIRKHARLSSNSVPFGPWTHQTSRPTPDRSPHIAVTWEKHVKWYQKRKEHAVLWLMKRSILAQKHNRVQRKVRQVLQHRGTQALCGMWLQAHAKEQMPHFELRVKAAKKLEEICKKASALKKRQAQAHESLKSFVKEDVVKKLMEKFEQRNYNVIYYMAYKKKMAFEYVRERTQRAKRERSEPTQHAVPTWKRA